MTHMKKKEIGIIAAVVAVCVCLLIGFRFFKKEEDLTSDATPSSTPKGKWVAIVHRNHVVQWFDSGIDAEYETEGDYGKMTVEVKDGSWHVEEVECPNQNCVQMGWDDGSGFIPITCLPNNIFIGTSEWVEGYLAQ